MFTDKLSSNDYKSLYNNDIRNRKKKQDNEFSSPVPSSLVLDNPEKFFRSCTQSEIRVYNQILHLSTRYHYVYPTQAKLAQMAGITRGHCSRILLKFMSLGLIAQAYRHMTSNIYKVPARFMSPLMRSRLSNIFSAFRYLSVSLLLSATISMLAGKEPFHFGYVTRLSSKAIKNIKNSNKCRPGGNGMSTILSHSNDENPISPLIRKQKLVNLTKWGQIKLSAFPDEAIAAALTRLEKATDVKDRFAHMLASCFDYCDIHEIKPNWAWTYQLAEKYHQPMNPKFVFEKLDPAIAEETPRSVYEKYKAPKQGPSKPQSAQQYTSRQRESVGATYEQLESRRITEQKYKEFEISATERIREESRRKSAEWLASKSQTNPFMEFSGKD